MGKIIQDKSGDVRSGVFYHFDVQYDDVVEDRDRRSDWIVVPRTPTDDQLRASGKEPWMVIEVDPQGRVETKDCPANPDHVTLRYYTKIEGQSYVGQVSPIIPSTDGRVNILSDDLRHRVERIDISGRRIDPIDLFNHYTQERMKGFWALQFIGRIKHRLPKFVDAANLCPQCGKGKIACESCGKLIPLCENCGKEMYVIDYKHAGSSDKRIPFEYGLHRVLDGKTWDGSDLVQSCYASKRFIDWLLRIHAAPFYAEPVWFCVDGMSDQQKKWFEELQQPFEV